MSRTAALVASAATVASFTVIAVAPQAQATTFGAGNIVVARVGSGAAALTGAATPVFLDEYTPAGTLVNTVALPTVTTGANRRLTLSGSATSEGALALTGDGRYLTLAGYDADPGTASVASTASATVSRVVARVDGAGAVDSSTSISDAFSATNVRSAVSDDGARYWVAGGSGGVRLAGEGSSGSSTQINSAAPTNIRVAGIAAGQLFVSTGSGTAGVYSVGAGLPTSGGQSTALVSPASSPYGFVALDRDPSVPGVDTLYVADDSTSGGILKFSSDGTAWTSRGTFRPGGSGTRGVTGAVNGNGATLFATTTNNQLVRVDDSADFSAPIAATANTIATAASNTALRGVAFAPASSAAVAPSISTQPATTTIASGETATLTVTATGTAPLSYQWYQGNSGDTSAPVGTDSPSFTTPALTATTSFWVRVTNSVGSADSQSATVTVGPAPCQRDVTTIGSVQGGGATSPVVGSTVSVRGVVVGDYEGAAPALGGFYLQDAGDDDPQTSDGIFVFDRGFSSSVSEGQIVEVTGRVSEFQGQTEIDTLNAVHACGTGDVTPTDVTLPLATADALEPYEGMLVRFHQTLTVTEHFQLGRFGEVVVSANGRLRQPTGVAAPGAAANAIQAANDLNQIKIDDDLQNQNPDPIEFGRNGDPLSASNTLRGGDTVTDPIGVLTYGWAGNAASPNTYRLRPINALHGVASFDASNPRPTSAPEVGGGVKVGGANLLNFFNDFTGCTFGVGGATTDCRGAENSSEYQRQLAKEVAALTHLNVDVLAVMEMENNGYGSSSAIQALVDAMNAATAPGRWTFINPDAALGVTNAAGDDAIKAAILYRTDRVTPTANTFVDTSSDVWERRPVAQEFESATGRFVVVANHFKSKGSCPASGPDADQGDGQSCWNPHRTDQARELLSFVNNTVVPASGDSDVLLLGDFNSYAKENPIQTLEASGYTNLVGHFHGDEAYSYAFDAQWGYLDYAIASPSMLARVTGADDYHINSDEPSVLDYNTNFKAPDQISGLYAPDEFRTSDHDSIRVGLNPVDATPPVVTPTVTGTVGNNGWYTSDVSVTWDVNEPDSSVQTTGCEPTSITSDTAGMTIICTASSAGGTTTGSVTVQRDATPPTVSWTGGVSDGARYVFGAVPAAPTCAAVDATSGPAGCTVSGYSTVVGTHTLTATATDVAGNVRAESRTYTVDPYTLSGFYQPVDNGGVYNVMLRGLSVPMPFEVFAGSTELKSPSVVSGLTVESITCDSHAAHDNVEVVTLGKTGLRYDLLTGRFVYTWQTPRAPGCYRATVTTKDGSSLSALFRLR